MQWLSNIRVGMKVLLASTVLIAMTVIVASQGIVALRIADGDINEFYKGRFVPVRQLSQIMQNLMQIRVNIMQEMVSAKNNDWIDVEKRFEDSTKLADEYRGIWNRYYSTKMSPEEKALADKWVEEANRPAELRTEYVQLLQAKDFAAAEIKLAEWHDGYMKVRDTTDKLIDLQQREGDRLVQGANSATLRATILSVVVMVIAVLMGVVITMLLSRAVTGPVRKGLAFAKKLAEGDLRDRIDMDQNDELGELAKALNRAADSLEGIVSNVIVSSQNLAQAVQQISSGNQSLSQRTSEQASSLEEIASTLEEATATINQNAENAQMANRNSEESYKLAEDGGRVVTEAVSSINEINSSSKKIGEIIAVINEIAFQTNLLALNAAVEAARAGEQGRGFAVVAGEVRNLAQRASGASKEIEALIKDSVVKVDKGTKLAQKSGEALQEIIKSIRQVSQVVSEIAAASQEQKQGMGQINVAVTEMDTMTQQNASLVEETASASEQMATQAQDLMAIMERFKIREKKETVKRDTHVQKPREVLPRAAMAEVKKENGNGGKRQRPAAPHEFTVHPAAQQGGDHVKRMLQEEGFEEF